MIALSLLALAGGTVLLVLAADRAVAGAEIISRRLNISPVVLGALIVGLGTSLPEMVVSGIAAVQRDTIDLAIGNVIGSNAANLTLVLGTGAVFVDILTRRTVFRREGVVMLIATSLLCLTLLDGRLERWEGGVLLVGMVVAAVVIARGPGGADSEGEEDDRTTGVISAVVLASLVGVVVGAQLVVTGATDVAGRVGLSEAMIGLTIVAIGTSLPELATTVASARRGSTGLIIGNVFGSNVFNSFAVAGVAGVLGSGEIDDLPGVSLAVMLGITLLALVAGTLRGGFTRVDGLVLLSVYPIVLVAGA